eukprot:CAMPEP_0201870544 /NCGR_PEP_ID=MMETSP0902-20130614/3621_1 /ASSEMBLY_ACC=CAM_ASM_000551 /TAXON_ID=420261 /ORGANISM="Thalassiosira antarctica, Strain CCMP982" /LENGTH=285 /DNA_ID=CAMNT_0048396193 /DNA_START=73 /DNA_END=930 /DNA_ORIENTATION=-
MIESMSDATIDTKVSAKDASVSGVSTTPNYPYLQILQQLQSKAIQAQDPAAAAVVEANEEKLESDPINNNNQQSWDLSTDALLATLLHEFSSHVASRTHHVASEIRNLQNSVNEAGVDVAICQTEFMKRSADIFMEQVVGDDESESDSDEDEDDGDDEKTDKSSEPKEEQNNDQDDDDSDSSSAEIARLEAEEKSAIADGMKALSLFFDPKRPNKSSSGSSSVEGDTMIDVEEDIIGENCYYYPSAEEDGFNQRPLPFIVGSREFMESSCAGLGGVGGENQSGEE